MPHLSDLLPVDDHLMPASERRPGDLRRSLAGRLGDGQGLRQAEVAAYLVAQVAGLPGDVEVLEHGPLPGDEISHTACNHTHAYFSSPWLWCRSASCFRFSSCRRSMIRSPTDSPSAAQR